ncbi:MAG: helix-turn-helix domain-containing protein [Rhizobiaceae bacterium]
MRPQISVKARLQDSLPVHPRVTPGRGAGTGSAGTCRRERAAILCDCVLDIAAAMFNVSGRQLRDSGRSTLDVSRIRQVAMYVCHVVFGLKMSEIGNGFGRDRTTVVHACHVVEDMRDDRDFDEIVSAFERVASAALKYHGG